MRNLFCAMSIAAIFFTLPVPVQASSDDAWNEFNARVTKECVRLSGLRNSRPSTIIGFDDRVGLVAMLVSDRTRGSNVSKLCLYDRRTKKAYVEDADVWSAPPQTR
jgi:hypothetical protein